MIEIRVGQLAQALGVHRNTVSNWIKSGKLPAVPTVGKRYAINTADLTRFCDAVGISREALAFLETPDAPPAPAAQPAPPLSQPIMKEVRMPEKPIGSVMVVGGGIAGIQASLDLANSGYLVHLVERSAGIGGAMAQLDKTYPTNDCAM